MKNPKVFYQNLLFAVFCLFASQVYAQSPGIIVRPAGGNGITILNPNGNGFSSATTNGFVSSDISESEIPYKVVPPIITEPTGDVATAPDGGFTDIVKTVDNSGFYTYYDGTNLLFRLRIGNIISGSKGYSIMFDTDGKIGSTSPYADPNYVAATNTKNGNPGFEYEVVLETNFNISVYNIDGTQNPVLITTYPLATHSQISVALSTDSGNPDYFYDFAIPITAIGSPASFRMVATTVTSPSSALQGSRSDIYGIDDEANTNTPTAWETVINSQPPTTPGDVGSAGSGPAAVCTAPPSLNGPINIGSNVAVTGSWTRLDASKPSTATITLYKNGVSAGTTTATSGNTWSITVASIAAGDVFYAKAVAAGESECLQSASVTAGCSSIPAVPVLTCASSKGISGTIGSGNIIQIYLLPTTNASPFSNPLTTNITYPTATSFAYYAAGCSGGTNNVSNGTYMLIASNGSCTSAPVFECITSGSSALTGLATNSITLTTPVYPYQTSISGSGVASGNILRLFINGAYISTITATGTSFTFTGLTLKSNDQIKIYLSTGATCMTVSNTFTVSCFAQPPVITTTQSGNLIGGSTSVSGTAAYAGATVTLYQGTAPGGVAIGTPATTSSSGNWTVSGITITTGQNYYATLTTAGCTSAASSAASALVATTICPTITGSYSDAATTVSGTLPSSFTGTIRLYIDGAGIGSTNLTAATTWSIGVNSSASNLLYSGGVLTATAQSSTSAEKTDCAGSVTVSCSLPTTPVVSPATTTISSGQTVNYTISNSASGILYSLKDNSANTYYASSQFGTGASLSFTTNTFTTDGTYNLDIKATSFSGPGCESLSAATIIVSSTLPLKLISFEGSLSQDIVLLKWKTSNEINVSNFEIQRSDDGVNFYTIGKVQATNNYAESDYSFSDPRKLQTRSWYRLLMVDIDGHTELSRIIRIATDAESYSLRVMPNPFTNKLDIQLTNASGKAIEIRLTDISGRTVKTIRQSPAQTLVVSINNLERLLPGVYIIQVVENGEVKLKQKVVKTK